MTKTGSEITENNIETAPIAGRRSVAELSNIALVNTVKMESSGQNIELNSWDAFWVEQLRENLSLIKSSQSQDFGYDEITPRTEKEKREKAIEMGHRKLGEDMIGYVEGCRAQNDFKKYRRYLDADEVNFLLNVDEIDPITADKNYYLMQIHDRVLGRVEDNVRPKHQVNELDFRGLNHFLKTDYIMNLNEAIDTYISSVSSKINKIDQLKDKLAAGLFSTNTDYFNKDISKLSHLDKNFVNNKNLNEIYRVIDGMRHEEAFKEMIFEMQDDAFEVIETDKVKDSHGIDLILRLKLSKLKTADGQYKIAEAQEIENGEFIETDLPIDVKSNRKRVDELRRNQQSYNGRPDHWIMWSHVYRDDFRLSVHNGTSVLRYKLSESPIYLNIGEQFAAMKNLGSVSYVDYNGKEFKPEPLSDRLINIKQEIEQGVNVIGIINPETNHTY